MRTNHIHFFICLILIACEPDNRKINCSDKSIIIYSVDSIEYYSDCVELLKLSDNDTLSNNDLNFSFPKLQEIRLEKTRLEKPECVIAQIGKIKKLTTLFLDFRGTKNIPKNLSEIRNVTNIAIFVDSMSQIGFKFKDMSQLTSLHIEAGIFDSEESLRGLTQLKEFGLNADIKQLPETIFEMNNLEKLNLSFNKDLSNIPEEISKLKQLKLIEIYNTALVDMEWETLKKDKESTIFKEIKAKCNNCIIKSNIN